MKKLVLLLFVSVVLVGCDTKTSSSEPETSTNILQETARFAAVSELFHDWEDINIMGGDVTESFTLTNTETEPLLLTGAVTSCMCTTSQIKLSDGSVSPTFGMHGNANWSYEVQPGESFEVVVTFDPLAHGPSATGPIKRTVNVLADPDPSQEGVTYTSINVMGNVLSESDFNNLYAAS